MYQKMKGTLDFFGEDSLKYNYVCDVIKEIIKNYGYEEMITPTFEQTEVFSRSSGDESDIVSKEMYTFKDKGDRSITLRPEGTAAIVRSLLENKLYANAGIQKYYYIGSMFRYDRPQAGRYREFKQFGIEALGEGGPLLDIEVILSAYAIFEKLGISKIKLLINSIGDEESRANYSNKLKEYFSKNIDSFCDDCKRRLDKNPMRILDCKVDHENEIMKNAPKIADSLNEKSKEYFKKIINLLDEMNITYEIDENLVRGLDYYTDTVFEYIIDDDSSLKGLAICAGGKYFGLVRKLGGPDIPGIGYAFGIERIIGVLNNQKSFPILNKNCDACLIGLDEESKKETILLAEEMRKNNLYVVLDYQSTSLKPQFKLADRKEANYIIIIGEEERQSKIYTVKNKKTGEQVKINKDEIIKYIKEGK